MEGTLEIINTRYPHLNPTEKYELLRQNLLPYFASEQPGFDSFKNGLEELRDLVTSIHDLMNSPHNPTQMASTFEEGYVSWFDEICSRQSEITQKFLKVYHLSNDLPTRNAVMGMVDAHIQERYPEFHKEYREHQNWLKTNQERLNRLEKKHDKEPSGESQHLSGPVR